MIKICKPISSFSADLLLKYLGSNYEFMQDTNVFPIRVYDVNHDLNEELVIFHTMPDGTEIAFSMISSNLFIGKNGNYESIDEEIELQNHCLFDLYLRNNMMYFMGHISYENNFSPNFRYKENFSATIVMTKEQKLLDIWIKHDKEIY